MKNRPKNYLIGAYVVRIFNIVAFIAYAWSLIMYEFKWVNLMMLFMTASFLHLPITKLQHMIQRMLGQDVKQFVADFNEGKREDLALDELILRSVSILILLFIIAKNLYQFFIPA